ncbi:MAG: SURF1 family cytochrome oxidase biogenesis protein [Microbacterium sp.]|uniref:SURF1 family cytochrome oxidase biogenesis protein n=1 Tax=Microbacterium sp. TaxID=51671 RepID=UPI0039E60401
MVFPPTLREVLVRPRWLALLGLCLVVAGVFAWLGQWQLGRAIAVNPNPPGSSEQVRPIDEVVQPGAYLPDPFIGQRVSVEGWLVPGDFIVVSSRFNDGVEGYWVTGQLRLAGTEQPTSLAVALGWAPTRAEADAAAARLDEAAAGDSAIWTGRLIADEGPVPPPRDAATTELVRMSPAALLSRWHNIDSLEVYRPFLTSAEPVAGLAAISSPPPVEGPGVNWLNIFYAAEWAVFCGFAFYLWYRLAKDAWEREVEDLEAAELTGASTPP